MIQGKILKPIINRHAFECQYETSDLPEDHKMYLKTRKMFHSSNSDVSILNFIKNYEFFML